MSLAPIVNQKPMATQSAGTFKLNPIENFMLAGIAAAVQAIEE